MRTQIFGWTGERIPLIGQGTWMIETHARDTAIQALRAGMDAGLSLIDTAEMYGDGAAEEIVGEAISGRRHELFLISKVLPSNASYDGTRRACERSLKRLGADQLDLYLLHWPGSFPIRETVRGLTSLVDDKLVRYIGVSNFDVEELQNALAAVTHARIACNQVLYHLGDRGIERRLIPLCESDEMAVMGYSPFGHRKFYSPTSKEGRILGEIAARHGGTPRQVVLAFLTRNGVFAIPKSGDVNHVRENAVVLTLTADDIHQLDRAFPAPKHDTPLGII